MKKLAFTISIILLMGLSIHSCEKEKVIPPKNTIERNSLRQAPYAPQPGIVIGCFPFCTLADAANNEYCIKEGKNCAPCFVHKPSNTQNIQNLVSLLDANPMDIAKFFSDADNFDDLFPLLNEEGNLFLNQLCMGNTSLTEILTDKQMPRMVFKFYDEKEDSFFALVYAEQ